MLKRTIKPAAFVSRSTFATYWRISPIHHRNARDIFENMELLFKIRRLFGGKFKPNLYLISANASTHHGDSFVNDSTDHNLEKTPMGLRYEHRKCRGRLLFKISSIQTWVKIRRLFGEKLVIRQVLNVPKSIQDFNEGFKEVKVGF